MPREHVMHARRGFIAALSCALLCAHAGLVTPASVYAAETPPSTTDAPEPAQSRESEADRLFNAVVEIETRAVPDAHSAEALGRERHGTGIVIGDDGLVLTIGYLVIEAAELRVIDSHGRSLPARVVAYDPPTGFGLVRTTVPLASTPVSLGDSGKLRERDPVMIVSHGGRDRVTLAYVVSRRAFAGNWEYALDEAIYTAPPTLEWSGAALIGRDGTLLGIGSLIVRDAMGGETAVPGNVFVPIDLLKPVLADLVRTGHRAGPARPWLGINADEVQGRLFVSRVLPEGPAEKAGIKAGDVIVAVGKDAVRTQPEFYRKVWAYGAAGTDIPLRVLQDDIDVREIKVRSMDRTAYDRPPTTH